MSAAEELLTHGTIRVLGRLPHSSNYTFLAAVSPQLSSQSPPNIAASSLPAGVALSAFEPPAGLDPQLFSDIAPGSILAVYKPGDGERPLWDFPDGLYKREVAAYRLSAHLGWDIVPETVVRDDAPLGTGSVQRFVDADFETHYFHLAEDVKYHEALVTVAVFDILANNTDRKAGHLLLDAEGRIWAIDNGLAFHEEPKLRTVIWDFAGEAVPARLIDAVARTAGPDSALVDSLSPYLASTEIDAVARRAEYLLSAGHLPSVPPGTRPYPWPIV